MLSRSTSVLPQKKKRLLVPVTGAPRTVRTRVKPGLIPTWMSGDIFFIDAPESSRKIGHGARGASSAAASCA